MEPKVLYSADAFAGLVSIDPFHASESAALDFTQSALYLSDALATESQVFDDASAADNTHVRTLDDIGSLLEGIETANAAAYNLQLFDTALHDVDYEFEGRLELIFIDSATPDFETLLEAKTNDPNTNYHVFLLDADTGGIEQISSVLDGLSGIDAIHLVGHGNSQGLQLGDSWLSNENIDTYKDSLLGWASALEDDADLLIYGCELAADSAGQLLINQLAELTTADVAASDDLTGASSLGGDWDLEHSVGQIDTALAFDAEQQSKYASVLVSFTVNVNTDSIDVNPGDGVALDADGNTSLRAAIMEANALASNDTIVLPSGAYTLSLTGSAADESAVGDLDVTGQLTIDGAGASTTRINADNIDRVFDVHAGAALDLSGVKIAGGSADEGAGIRNAGSLNLEDSVLTSNVSTGTGGGMYTSAGSTTNVERVEISHNQAVQGAGVYAGSSTMTIANTTFSTNTSSAEGGGMYVFEANVTVTNNTFSANIATGGATGIETNSGGTSVVAIANTLFDSAGDNLTGDPDSFTSAGNNIDTNTTSELDDASDQSNVTVNLGPLANNGGPTQTHALIAGVTTPTAANAINPVGLTGAPTTDQRGLTRDATPDIGAYEHADDNAPVFTSNGPFPVDEGTAVGVVVGDVDVNDGDGGVADADISYSLVSNVDLDGDGVPAFAIHAATGVITVGDADDIDFEVAPTLSLTVEASDGELTTADGVIVNLIDVAPTISASGAAEVNVGEPYALALTATEPGTSGISTYTVNWGDGTVTTEAYAGPITTVSHIYANVGFTNNITFTANDVSNTLTNSDLVTTSWRAGDDIFVIDGNTGTVTGTFDSTGNELRRPYGIAVGPDGNIYVSGFDSRNIVHFAPDGTYLGEFANDTGNGLDDPAGLAWGADGNLYVANNKDDNIYRFAADGSFIDIWADNSSGDLDSPEGLAFGPDGNLYVSDSADDDIIMIDGANGGPGTRVLTSGLSDPEQLVFDAAGNLFIANGNNNNVVSWNVTAPTSTASEFLTHPELDYASGIGIGPDGRFYVTSFQDNTVLRTDGTTDEVFVTSGSGGLNDPSQLVFTPDQQVKVTENTAPTAVNLNSTSTYNEGAASVTITDIVVNDADTGEIFTATLTLADTASGSLSDNDGASYDTSSGVWSIEGVADSVNLALANLVFFPTENNDVDTTISVVIDDGDGDGSGPLTGTINLNVTAANDAPTATSLTSIAEIVVVGDNVPLTDIVVSDADTGEIITATLIVDRQDWGRLTPNNNATYNSFTGVWRIAGTVSEVNTALANVEYDPIFSNDNNNTISVSIDDDDEDSGGPLTGTISIINSVPNTPPSATNLTSDSSYVEGDASVDIENIVVSDDDSGEEITATLTLADTVAGTLSANDGASYNPTTGVWNIADTRGNVNTALANLVFIPAPNNEIDTSISVDIDDGNEDGGATLTGTISLNVTAENDAPTAVFINSTSNYLEGDSDVVIEDIVVSDVDANEILTATLTLVDVNSGSLTDNDGAVYDNTNGIWTITGTVEVLNTALANLAFIPVEDNDIDTSISVDIDDDDEDNSGSIAGTVTLSVAPVNDAPTTNSLNSVVNYTEGDNSIALENIVVSDVDTNDNITATLTLSDLSSGSLSDNDGAIFESTTGVWSITDTVENVNSALANLEFNSSDDNELNSTITVSITDGNIAPNDALTGSIELNVTTENDAPTATNLTSVSSYDEGDLSVDILDIVVNDADAGEIITAELVLNDTSTGSLSAEDGAEYIASTGVWSVTGSASEVNMALANVVFYPQPENDSATSIEVNIKDDEGVGDSPLTGTISLNVLPINDAPVITQLESSADYTEGAERVPLKPFSIVDIDNDETVTATLVLANVNTGTLSSNDGATYANETGVWTITGDVAAVNTALANVEFIPVANNTEDTTISISIDDGDEDASGPLVDTISINVTPLPEVELPAAALPEVIDEQEEEEQEPEIDEPELAASETNSEDPASEETAAEDTAKTTVEEFDEPVLLEVDIPVVAPLNDFQVVQDDVDSGVEEKVTRLAVYSPTALNILKTELTEELNLLDDPLQYIGAESFVSRLDDLREELDSDSKTSDKIIGSSMTATAGLSVGYVIWLARSGILLSSALSSLPAWRFIDPLPVLGSLHNDESDDDESLESMVREKDEDSEDQPEGIKNDE